MFSNSKLRLLMTLAGFERLGVEDIPGASWVVPSALKSTDLRETKSTIDKSLEKPPADENERDPRYLLKRVKGERQNFLPNADVNFGSDSEGEDQVPDGLLFPPNPRSKSNALDELKKKRKKRTSEREPLDDETIEQRRRTREENALARNKKIKSELYIHASDEESDEDADAEFFRLEEQRRKEQSERIRRALLLGREDDTLLDQRKRKNGNGPGGVEKRQRQSPPGEEEDIAMTGVHSRESPSDHEAPDDLNFDDDLAFSQSGGSEAAEQPGQAEQGEEDDEPVAAAARRKRIRGGFVIDSDSE